MTPKRICLILMLYATFTLYAQTEETPELSADNRDSEIQAAAATYAELQEIKFLDPNNRELIDQYEATLKSITEKSDITQDEIDSALLASISDVVDSEFEKVSLSISRNYPPPPPDVKAEEPASDNQVAVVSPSEKETKPPKVKKPKEPFSWERRNFEMGFDLGVGFANDLLGAKDIFKETIEMKDFSSKVTENGWNISLEPDFDFFFNITPGRYWGGGLLVGVDGGINANIPKSLFELLSEGNADEHDNEGDFSVSGAIFAAIEVEVHGRLKSFDRLKFGLTPGVFYPLAYIPKASVAYGLNTGGGLHVFTRGNIDVYTPFSLDTLEDPVGSVFSSGGFDISLAGEYALFVAQKWGSLAVGGSLEHIPFVPATLKNKMTVDMNKEDIINTDNLLDILIDGGDLYDIGGIGDTSYSSADLKVMRPMRVDFYAVYQPFTTDWLTVTPNLGFTVLTAGDPSFNWGLNSQVNFRHMIEFHIGTGWDELVWDHHAGLVFNFRAFELDIDASLRSQDFVKSFQLNGLSAKLGLRWGW
jgi:hypothetical protein